MQKCDPNYDDDLAKNNHQGRSRKLLSGSHFLSSFRFVDEGEEYRMRLSLFFRSFSLSLGFSAFQTLERERGEKWDRIDQTETIIVS